MPPPKVLADVLPVHEIQTRAQSLRWSVTVPLVTNPFLLVDVFWFALLGGSLVFAILVSGVWFTEGAIRTDDIRVSLHFASLTFGGCIAAYILLSLFFFKNRYFAVYELSDKGIYREGSRGSDDRPSALFLHMRPCPVAGSVRAARTKGKSISWAQADCFQDVRTMRVIHIKRGIWHVLRLYTPDNATHKLAIKYISKHLPAKNK